MFTPEGYRPDKVNTDLITYEQLKAIAPNCPKNADVFIPYLNDTLRRFDITTKERICMFIAQIAHESGSFRYTQEIASGKAYEGRADLGNVEKGDGVRFKGRSFLQITGRDNYRQISKDMGIDFLTTPQLLETPQYACLASGWFWDKKGLNKYADAGNLINYKQITRRINGGYTHLAERVEYWERAKKVICDL